VAHPEKSSPLTSAISLIDLVSVVSQSRRWPFVDNIGLLMSGKGHTSFASSTLFFLLEPPLLPLDYSLAQGPEEMTPRSLHSLLTVSLSNEALLLSAHTSQRDPGDSCQI